MADFEIKGVCSQYGSSRILFDVDLKVRQGEAVCLLGRNGAGKTTTLKSIVGLAQVTAGSIRYRGQELVGQPTYKIAQMGIGYVPDERLIFPDLTVRENLALGRKFNPHRSASPWTIDRIFEVFPLLERLESRLGGYLSGGEQQMLTLGRTLMGNPDLLLLDEPVEGVAPIIVQELSRQIQFLKAGGLTILLAEQNIHFAESIADRAYVVEKGRIRFEGTFAELQSNESVKKEYLMI